MATHFDGQLDLDVEVMPVEGKADRRENQQDTDPTIALLAPSSTVSSILPVSVANYTRHLATSFVPNKQSRELLTPLAATEYQTSIVLNDALDIRVATELNMILKYADSNTDTRGIKNLDDSMERTLRIGSPYIANTKEDSEDDRNFESQSLRPPRKVSAIEMDRQSTLSEGSEESEDTNEYELMARVRGLDWVVDELLLSFDTQSPAEIIFRPALEKLGNIKEHSIPGKLKAFESPLNPEELIVPTKFVRLRLWVYQIGLHVEVDLKIMEVPEEPNGFQVILGRKFLRENGGSSLLIRIEEANRNGSQSVASASNLVAAVRRAKRSKAQHLIDEAKKQALREQTLQTHTELYQNRETLSILFPGSSMQTQFTINSNGSQIGGDQVSHSAEYLATLVFQQGNYAQPTVPQPAQMTTAAMPDYAAEWQSNRANSSSTQFTEYSFGRRDTASSMSSWEDVDGATYAPKEREPASQPTAQQGSTCPVSSNEY